MVTSELRKTLIHALIACALGVALGLLSDGARAANEGKPQPNWVTALVACESKPGADNFLCWIHHVPEPQGRIDLNYALAGCLVETTKSAGYAKLCDEWRAYGRQRWGY